MNYKTIACECCGASKDIYIGEYNRKLKLGTKFYCSNKCGSSVHKDSFVERTKEYKKSSKNIEHLKNLNNLKVADPFRYFIKTSKNRDKTFSISIEHLKDLWKQQKGLCALSNIQLELPLGSKGFESMKPFNAASLDRIDSNQGYVEGNVQFICRAINYMKNDWDEKYFKEWLLLMSKSVLDKYKDVLDNNKVIEV